MRDTTKLVKELLSLHEFHAHLVPGVILLYVLNLIFPQIGNFISNNLSIGSFMLFMLLSYPTGHLIQAFGNIIEKIIEYIFGDVKKYYKKQLKIDDIDKLYDKAYKNSKNKIKVFKADGKLRRGIATSLLILLIIGWVRGFFNSNNLYILAFGTFAVITMFWYARKAEHREIEQVIKFGK